MATSGNRLVLGPFHQEIIYCLESWKPIAVLTPKGQALLGLRPTNQTAIVDFLCLRQIIHINKEIQRSWNLALWYMMNIYERHLRNGDFGARYWHQQCQFFTYLNQNVNVSGTSTSNTSFAANGFDLTAIIHHVTPDRMTLGGFDDGKAVFIDCFVDGLEMTPAGTNPTAHSDRLSIIRAESSEFDDNAGAIIYKGVKFGRTHHGIPIALLNEEGLKDLEFNVPYHSPYENWAVEFFDLYTDIARVNNKEYLEPFLRANQRICEDFEFNVLQHGLIQRSSTYKLASFFDHLSRKVKLIRPGVNSWDEMTLTAVSYTKSKPQYVCVAGLTDTGRFIQAEFRLENAELWSDQSRKSVKLMLKDMLHLAKEYRQTHTQTEEVLIGFQTEGSREVEPRGCFNKEDSEVRDDNLNADTKSSMATS